METGLPQNNPIGAADQLRRELMRTVVRYAQESDVTICETIGVLEIVKDQLLVMFEDDIKDPS